MLAFPEASVKTVSSATVPEPKTLKKTTGTPATGLVKASVTCTTSGSGRSCATVSTCALPLTIAMAVGAEAVPVAVKEVAGAPGDAEGVGRLDPRDEEDGEGVPRRRALGIP